MKEVKSFTINRAKWRTGRYGKHLTNVPHVGPSQLRNEHGFKCCLGFYSLACGIRGVTGAVGPAELVIYRGKKVPGWMEERGANDAVDSLIKANDSTGLTDPEREKMVREGFAEQGIKVKFVGKYPKVKP